MKGGAPAGLRPELCPLSGFVQWLYPEGKLLFHNSFLIAYDIETFG